MKKATKAPKKTASKNRKVTFKLKAVAKAKATPRRPMAKLKAKPLRAPRKAQKKPPLARKYDPAIMLHEVLGILPIFEPGDLVALQNAIRDRLKNLGVVAEVVEPVEVAAPEPEPAALEAEAASSQLPSNPANLGPEFEQATPDDGEPKNEETPEPAAEGATGA